MDELKMAKALEEFINTKLGPIGLNDAFTDIGDAVDAAVKEAYEAGYRDGYFAAGREVRYLVPPNFRELLLAVKHDTMGTAICNPVDGKDWFKARHELLFGNHRENANNRMVKIRYTGDPSGLSRGELDAYRRNDGTFLVFVNTGWYAVAAEDCEIMEGPGGC